MYMKQFTIILVFWLCSGHILLAQNLGIGDLPIQISYFGENGIHPGLKIGIEYPLVNRKKERERFFIKRQEKFGSKVRFRQLFLSGSIGTYFHPNNHLGLFVGTELGTRKIKDKHGNFIEFNLGVGYLRRFYTLDTFSLDANESLQQIGAAGNGSFMISIAPAFGRDLSIKKGKALRWFIKPGLQFSRYNHRFLPNGFLELGLQLRINTGSSII